MAEIEDRLARCFSAVFPDLPSAEIRKATPDTVSSWNSLSAVTLVAVTEEEFGINIGPLELAELDSFEAFLEYVSQKVSVDRSAAE
jgi:acyl carrier protein